MHVTDMWFPLDNSTHTSGRFIDHQFEHTNTEGVQRTITQLILETKGMGSIDTSNYKVNDKNKAAMIARCPAGWAHYENMKAKMVAAPEVFAEPTAADLGIKGTPIEEAAQHMKLNNNRIRWFKEQGIYSVQQVADLTDMACQNLGKGAVGWRKTAKEFLAGKAAA
jgi:hypothetical protein